MYEKPRANPDVTYFVFERVTFILALQRKRCQSRRRPLVRCWRGGDTRRERYACFAVVHGGTADKAQLDVSRSVRNV